MGMSVARPPGAAYPDMLKLFCCLCQPTAGSGNDPRGGHPSSRDPSLPPVAHRYHRTTTAENDGLAGLMLEWADAAGLRVPEDLGLMGVDDLAGAAGAFPHPLTSIELPSETIGRRAVGLLLEWIRRPRRRGILRDERIPPGALHERQTTGSAVHPDPLLRRALACLEGEQGCAVRASELARKIGTSRETLQRRFREKFGHSPREEIERRRFALAMDLLRRTTLRVGEITARCGHAKQSTFATRFRQRIGMTPSEYRERYRS